MSGNNIYLNNGWKIIEKEKATGKTDTMDKQHGEKKKKVNQFKIFREIEIRSLLIGADD